MPRRPGSRPGRRGRAPGPGAPGEDADHREPAAAEPDLAAGAGDAEPLGRVGAEHHRRVAGGGPVQEAPVGQLPAEGAEQRRVGRQHADAAGLDLGDLVGAVHGGVGVAGGRHPLHRPDPAHHARRLLGQLGLGPEEGLARGDPEQVGAERSSWASRSARLDAEMPTTATIAAMPMAMPSADRAARSRRVRSPVPAAASRSRRPSRPGRLPLMPPAPAITSRSIRPSRMSTRRGRRPAIARSWVMTTTVVPSACSSRAGPAPRPRRPSRGCRSARRPAPSPAGPPPPGRSRPAGARRRTARAAGGQPVAEARPAPAPRRPARRRSAAGTPP